MYTYISKETGSFTHIVDFSVTSARDKGRIHETIFKIFILKKGQNLPGGGVGNMLGIASLFLEKVEQLFSKDVIMS